MPDLSDQLPEKIHSSTLVALTGLTERHLRGLSAKKIIPEFDRAWWPATPTLRALFEYLQKRAAKRQGPEEVTAAIDREKLRKLRLSNAKAAREVIDFEGAKKAIGDVLLTFVAKAEDIPDKVAAPLANKPAEVIRDRIAAELRELREALSTPPDFHFLDEEPLSEDEAEDNEDTALDR